MMAWLMPVAPWLPPMTSKRLQIFAQPELLPRDLAIDALEFRANRRAGNFRAHFWEKTARIP